MALRGTLEHPKTLALAEKMHIPACYALGVLEAFWHFVARYRPDGDITGIDQKFILSGMRLGSGRNRSTFVYLIECGFIDKVGERLIVHDWHVHADQSVKKRLARNNQQFANQHVTGQNPDMTGQNPDMDILPDPVPDPVSRASIQRKENPAKEKSADADFSLVAGNGTGRVVKTPRDRIDSWFEEFWGIVWAKIGRGAAETAFRKVATSEQAYAAIMAAAQAQGPLLRQHAASNGHSVLHPATWLNQQRWQDDPEALKRDINGGVTRMTPTDTRNAATEAAARMFLNSRREG